MNNAVILKTDFNYKLIGKDMVSYIIDTLKTSFLFDNIIVNYLDNVLCKCVNNTGHTLFFPDNIPLLSIEEIRYFINSSFKNKITRYIIENGLSKYYIYSFDNNLLNKANYDLLYKEVIDEEYNEDNIIKNVNVVINDNLFNVCDYHSLSLVEKKLINKINLKHMLNGVYLMNPDSIVISPDAKIGGGTTIYPGCMIMGNTKIGKNCIVGPYTETMNATIEDNVVCKQSVVYDSKILSGAQVGPFTHLRMNSVVGINDRIGNFVEMKNSTLGEKTNVAHLTYIGDTTCGSHVNWGCGTVTVNYDGKNKHKTIIGDNVFIGCNTNLIAPIKVASDSFIAAGSTVINDTEEADFVIARSKPVVKRKGAYKYKK